MLHQQINKYYYNWFIDLNFIIANSICIYKFQVLPTLDGYLHEGGYLNLKRFERFMEQLSEFDVEKFEEENADLKFFGAKK